MTQWQTQIEQLRKDQRVPLLLAGLFAVLLLWAAGDFISTFRAHAAVIHAAKTAPAPKPIYNLADLHLLGIYQSNLDALPATQLPFTLEGTIVIPSAPTQSRALIASTSAPAKVYQVGDALSGNVTITRIATYFVVINNDGTLEKIALPINMLKNGFNR